MPRIANDIKLSILGSTSLAVWGFLAAACISGCATGADSGPGSDSPTSGDGGADAAAIPGSDGGSSHDSGTVAHADAGTPGADSGGAQIVPDAGSDAEGPADAGADVAVVADSGTDAAVGKDSGAPADAGSKVDASADAAGAKEAGGPDASPTVSFGTNCPAGTVYSDAFAADPLTSGNWTTLIGPTTYDSANHLLQLAQGNPNTQMWIGARPAWTNFTVSVQVRLDSSSTSDAGYIGNGGVNFRIVDPGPTNPPNDSGQMYFAGINATQVLLGVENTGWAQLALQPATFTLGTFYNLTVSAQGSSLSVAVDGTTYATVTDTTFSTGGIGLRTYLAGASYGNVTVTCGP